MLKAIIFDLDGTITDSEPLHLFAEKKVLREYGIKITSEELEKYTGTTSSFMFNDLIKRYHLKAAFEELLEAKSKIFIKLIETKLKPFPGVVPLIKQIKTSGLKLALASSGQRRFVEYSLKKFKIFHLFATIITAQDIKKSKPDPEIFLKAAKAINVAPRECLVFEDAKFGVQGAKAAGMYCIGFKKTAGHQDLSPADLIIESYKSLSLKEIIKKIPLSLKS